MFAFFKKLPKWAFVISVIGLSTSVFLVWWLILPPWQRDLFRIHNEKKQEDIARRAKSLEDRIFRLFIADGDLYDSENGDLVFTNWLKGDRPSRLFYDPTTKKLIGLLENGFARYALDGTRETTLGLDCSPAFSGNLEKAVYCKNGDIWTADINWNAFSFSNERKVTSTGEFNNVKVDSAILLSSPRYLILRHKNKAILIDMETGAYRPSKIPGKDILKRRSPDLQQLIGEEGDKLFVYDVETDKGTAWPIGRDRLVDCQWLSHDRCAALVAGQKVALYDRNANTLLKQATLPFPCQRMAEPSPNGRYVFCGNRTSIALVDFEAKTATQIPGGNGLGWLDNTTFIFSRDVDDSERRGTFLQGPGGSERRISPDPYLTDDNGKGAVFRLSDSGSVLFASKTNLYRMKPDGSELKSILQTRFNRVCFVTIEPMKKL